jgi:hypothetical protein
LRRHPTSKIHIVKLEWLSTSKNLYNVAKHKTCGSWVCNRIHNHCELETLKLNIRFNFEHLSRWISYYKKKLANCITILNQYNVSLHNDPLSTFCAYIYRIWPWLQRSWLQICLSANNMHCVELLIFKTMTSDVQCKDTLDNILDQLFFKQKP